MAKAKYNDYTRMRYDYYHRTDGKGKDERHHSEAYREQGKMARMRMLNPEGEADQAPPDAVDGDQPEYVFDDGPFHYNGHSDLFDDTEFRYNHSDLFARGGPGYNHSDLFDE